MCINIMRINTPNLSLKFDKNIRYYLDICVQVSMLKFKTPMLNKEVYRAMNDKHTNRQTKKQNIQGASNK